MRQLKAFRTDPDKYAQFTVARELRMTVSEMQQRMSSKEFTEWIAYFAERHRRELRSSKRAQRNARTERVEN